MTTLQEALAQQRYYPSFIRLEANVAQDVPPLTLAGEFFGYAHIAGFANIVRYAVAGMRGDVVRGSQAELERKIAELGPEEAFFFSFWTEDDASFSFSRGQGGQPVWRIEGRYPSETIPTVEWMESMAKICVAASGASGFKYAVLARHETSWAEFPPMPPLARYNHVVTVTEQEVADAYEDPASFWKCWDRVERVDDQRICIRALDKLEVTSWLAETFESTMHLARIARPNLTIYRKPGDARPAFAPWWEYGDIIADERAGYPALSLVGYDPATRTIEYAGFCTDTDIAKGGPDPRHVLIREIHEIRALVKAKKDQEGRPVDTVRVVFPEEWMARRERRPLRDVGARVYFMDSKGKDIEVTD
jgi:hypothetical protein